MNEAQLDRQKEEALKAKEKRQRQESINRCYSDIKGGVAKIQDAADTGTKVANSYLLNLLEEPLEKLIKLIDFIEAKEYVDNFIKQRKYLVSSLDRIDTTLKERLENIVKLFDLLIDKLSSDTEKKKLQIELLNHIFNSDKKEFDVDYYVSKGIDFNELIDCEDINLPNDRKGILRISIFGASLSEQYPITIIKELLMQGINLNSVCKIVALSHCDNGGFVELYPLYFSIFPINEQGINRERFKVLLEYGMNLNGCCKETFYSNNEFYGNKYGLLYVIANLPDVDEKIIDPVLFEVIKELKIYGLDFDSSINRNMISFDGQEKYSITDYFLDHYPLDRKLQKIFVGCSYNKDKILERVLGAFNYGNFGDYINSKNYMLFLAGNDVNILTDFSYRISWSDGEDEYIGSILGVLARNIYRQNKDAVLEEIISDFENLLKTLKVEWGYIALKNNGIEYSFYDVRQGNI